MTSRIRPLALTTTLAALTSTAHADPPLYSPIIYLERCTGGCTITNGPEDARTASYGLSPQVTTAALSEFVDSAGNTGAAADAEWSALVACVAETFSPYAVTITDQRPADGTPFNLAVVAGSPSELGFPPAIWGISSTDHCDGGEYLVSFTFPASIPAGPQRSLALCGAVARGAAIEFGLDNLLAFPSGRQICTDALAWNGSGCGGQRYFRDDVATCGATSARTCQCGSTSLNTHRRLLEAFGPAQSTTPPPTSLVTVPAPGATLGAVFAASAGSRRGVDRVELWLNGHKWAEAPGAQFLAGGQPDPSSYTFMVPAGLPDSVIDVVARAYDDLGTYTDSEVVTVTKGPEGGCVSAATCADGQKCEDGRCFWDPPAGELGDECTYAEFCLSGVCGDNGDEPACTQSCVVDAADSCPSSFECVAQTGGQGFCFRPVAADGGGCCSASGGAGNIILALAVGLPWLTRRRRRGTAGPSRDSRSPDVTRGSR